MNTTNDSEEWRVIAEFPNYEVSSLGRVRSWAPAFNSGQRPDKPSPVAVQSKGHAYPSVTLCREGKSFTRQIHVLVAKAFCPRVSPAHNIVRHDDGNEQNCRASNLIWGTSAQNRADQYRHGTAVFGERSPRARLTDAEAKAIFESDETCSVLAQRYGVAPTTISNIRTGRSRRHSGHSGKSPGALGVGGRHRPMKINADQAKEIFLSTEKHAELAQRFGLSVPTIHYIQIRRKWRLATEGLVAPERVKRTSGAWRPGRIGPLHRLTPEIVAAIFTSPLNGREVALKFGVLESHVSQIRSRKVAANYTRDLVAPSRPAVMKLDAEKARAIFRTTGRLRETAEQFGVTITMVSLIRRRCAWAEATKDLPDCGPG